jgi:hypothetical protein
MAHFNNAYEAIAAISLWYKNRAGDPLMLSDVPKIISLRWADFRDNWEFIKASIENQYESAADPDIFNDKLQEMSDFIIENRKAKLNPFDNSSILFRFYSIFDMIPIRRVALSRKEQTILDEELKTIAAYSRDKFEAARRVIVLTRDTFAGRRNLEDADYNRIFGRSTITAISDASIYDIQQMQQLMDAIKTIDFILANEFQLTVNTTDPFQLARDNANNPEIDIQNYASGFLTRFQYGDSLQKVAQRFLGNADKWIDIAIANGLRPPYVDEIGQKIFLLTNGDGNKINIAAIDGNGQANKDKFYPGQTIFLQSSTQTRAERRVILNIEHVPISGNIILELDGDSDLEKYTLSDTAYARVYLPNTINSNFFILIPSTQTLPDSTKANTPFFLENAASDEKRQGVDLALSETADLILTSTDDLQLSFGLANSIQAVKLKLIIEQGELNRHSSFGLVNIIGDKTLTLERARSELTRSIMAQINADDRFDRIERLSITGLVNAANLRNGSGLGIKLSVRLAGTGHVVPIVFSIASS